ncbi:hypothetical protein OUZ56_032101 [Daphnia magna]|uniref:Uncharacterized protein n=1 Tax=Daphnia magna TaxID=35525 RepID=A0ABQ9ZW55_9CRUS|nr:hypothetical protein OUZ56_032101 [Daphnia magna]
MQLHVVEGEPENGESGRTLEEYVTHELRQERCSMSEDHEWTETLTVDGASCNVLPQEEFLRLPARRQRLRPGPRLRGYGAKNGYLTVFGVHMAKKVASGAVHVLAESDH